MLSHDTNFLVGDVLSIQESHRIGNNLFYEFKLRVDRLSDNKDYLPVIVPEKILYNTEVAVGSTVKIAGEVRSRNYKENGRFRLSVFFFAYDISLSHKDIHETFNHVEYVGYVVKAPSYREKNNRKITELLVARNMHDSRSYYIPTICWGIDASFSSKLKVGECVSIKGHFRSREYVVFAPDGEEQKKETHEVSVFSITPVTQEGKKHDSSN